MDKDEPANAEDIGIADLRFLVVEDHGFQRWALGHALEKLGAKTVLHAGDGQTGLEIYKSAEPPLDIVITDLNMPGMDGMEFIRHIGEFGIPVAVIVATDQERVLLASVETMVRAYGVNLIEGIQKPVTAAKLAAALGRYQRTSAATSRGAPAAERLYHLEQIAAGIEGGEFEPFFQPQVELATGRMCGAEAVARWRHPVYGIVGANAFIPVLETSWQLDNLTMVMVREALACCKTWRVAGIDATVSINLSLTSLADVTLADRLMEIVREAEADPRRVVFEITETALTTDMGKVLENLSRLRMKGFGLSIDDFGTGYSSMQQLTRIPFTELKIDQSFVRAAPATPSSRAVVESSLEMAAKLRITAIAEGVENKEQAALLRELGCPVVQGHLIAPPMRASDFLRWSVENRRQGAA